MKWKCDSSSTPIGRGPGWNGSMIHGGSSSIRPVPVLRSVYQLTRTRLDVECRFLIIPEVPVTQILRNMTGEHVDDRPSVSVRRRVWLSLRGDDVSDSVYWPNFHRGSRSSVVGERFSPKYLASKNKKGDKRGGNLNQGGAWFRVSFPNSCRDSVTSRIN